MCSVSGCVETSRMVYRCGGCHKQYQTLCQLHKHMLDHGVDGSYFYNNTTHEALPRFSMICSSTQTSDVTEDVIYQVKNETNTDITSDLYICRSLEIPGSCSPKTDENEKTEDHISESNGNKETIKENEFQKKERKNSVPRGKKKITDMNENKSKKKSNKINISNKNNCKLCEKKFVKKIDLRHHIQIDHKLFKFLCLKCCISFESQRLLENHNSEQHFNAGHKCELCNKVLSTKNMLEGHYLIHKGVKPYSCDICVPKREFVRKSQLKAHMDTHSEEKNLQCEFCGKAFNARCTMINHVKHCSGIKPYQCEFCEMRFINNFTLEKHRRKHTGEKPYICEVCAFASSNAACLARHLRTHTGEKPYACLYCSMKFASPSAKTKHMRTHTLEKPYKCSYCTKAFTQRWNLKTHERQHTGDAPYKCDICGVGFKQKVLLKTHLQFHSVNKQKHQSQSVPKQKVQLSVYPSHLGVVQSIQNSRLTNTKQSHPRLLQTFPFNSSNEKNKLSTRDQNNKTQTLNIQTDIQHMNDIRLHQQLDVPLNKESLHIRPEDKKNDLRIEDFSYLSTVISKPFNGTEKGQEDEYQQPTDSTDKKDYRPLFNPYL